jgi:hypothetical protein
MDQPHSRLVSPAGKLITGTLERMSGRANIVADSVRKGDGGIEFDYDGSTDIFWDEQHTVTREGELVFLDEDGNDYLESELRLVPAESDQAEEGK